MGRKSWDTATQHSCCNCQKQLTQYFNHQKTGSNKDNGLNFQRRKSFWGGLTAWPFSPQGGIYWLWAWAWCWGLGLVCAEGLSTDKRKSQGSWFIGHMGSLRHPKYGTSFSQDTCWSPELHMACWKLSEGLPNGRVRSPTISQYLGDETIGGRDHPETAAVWLPGSDRGDWLPMAWGLFWQ